MKSMYRSSILVLIFIILAIIVHSQNFIDADSLSNFDEYVTTVHADSTARREALQAERVLSDSVWPHKAWGDTRWALHCLYQNKRVAEANERIRNRTNVEFPFKDIYFACADYMQILALFRENSPFYPGRLEPSTEELMKKKLFEWAQYFEEHWDGFRRERTPKIDPIWKVYASENHDLVRKGNNVLIYEILAEDPEYRNRKIKGRPITWYAQWYNDYIKRWIRSRAANGMWKELCSGYIKYSCALFINWHDLSKDPELRQLAKMYLDLIFIEEAQASFSNGNRALSGSRIRELQGMRGLSAIKGLFYGEYGSSGSHLSNYEVTKYQIPAAAIWLRTQSDKLDPFIITNRLPIESLAPGKKGVKTKEVGLEGLYGNTFYINENSQSYNYIYKTSDYSMASYQNEIDDDPTDCIGDFSGISSQSHQSGILFNDGIKGGSRVMPFMSNGLGRTYRHPYWTVQHKNLMISQRTANKGTYVDRGMVYVSPFLEKVETAGWIFLDAGDAWAAVYPCGGYQWGPSTHPEKWPGEFILPHKDDQPIVYYAGNRQDGHESFETFQNFVLNDIDLRDTERSVKLQRKSEPELTFYKDYRLPKVEDPESLYATHPPLVRNKTYQSPYLKTGRNNEEIIVRWENRQTVYDFDKAQIKEMK